MALHDLLDYDIISFSYDGQAPGGPRTKADLLLTPTPALTQAHFPGFPVLPGALQLQLAGELLNTGGRPQADRGLTLQGIVRAKFLHVVELDRPQRICVAWREQEKEDGLLEMRGELTGNGNLRCTTFTLLFRKAAGPGDGARREPDRLRTGPKMLDKLDCCIVVPAYNCWPQLYGIMRGLDAYSSHILIVDDGSEGIARGFRFESDTPETPHKGYTQGTDVNGVSFTVIRHARNRGKGAALATGFAWARAQGFRYALTIDADGQHAPEDIPALARALREQPGALVVGCRRQGSEGMPRNSRFANRFSNFWFCVQTLRRLPDTQSGFRIYPLDRLCPRRLLTARYEAELLLLVWAAWAGVPLVAADISVYYPPAEERISHFRPLRDFGRISLLNCALCIVAVCYGIPRTLFRRLRHAFS